MSWSTVARATAPRRPSSRTPRRRHGGRRRPRIAAIRSSAAAARSSSSRRPARVRTPAPRTPRTPSPATGQRLLERPRPRRSRPALDLTTSFGRPGPGGLGTRSRPRSACTRGPTSDRRGPSSRPRRRPQHVVLQRLRRRARRCPVPERVDQLVLGHHLARRAARTASRHLSFGPPNRTAPAGPETSTGPSTRTRACMGPGSDRCRERVQMSPTDRGGPRPVEASSGRRGQRATRGSRRGPRCRSPGSAARPGSGGWRPRPPRPPAARTPGRPPRRGSWCRPPRSPGRRW